MALAERRYRRNRSVRFYRHLARTGSAFPRLPRRFAPHNDNLGECRGAPAPLHGLIPLYKALTARKGHAASVRRQSRQRLRRERRYRRNWFVRLSMACTGRRHCAGRGMPLPYKACAFARQLVQIGSAEIATAPVGPLREPAGAQNRRRGALPCGGFWINRIIRCGQRRRPWQPRRQQRRQPCRHAGQMPSE